MRNYIKTFIPALIASLITFGFMYFANVAATRSIIPGYSVGSQVAILLVPIITAIVATVYQHQFKTSGLVAILSSGVGTCVNLLVVPNLVWIVIAPMVILLWSGNTSDQAQSLMTGLALIVGLAGFMLTVFGAAMVAYVIDWITN